MKLIAKRLFELILFLFLLSFISFAFMKAAPGDPVKQMLRVDDVAVTDEQIEEFREELGFNKPIYIQYWNWFKRFFQLDFGHSYTTGQPVITELSRTFPATLLLTGTSLLVMLLISVPIGTLSALYRDRWLDHTGRLLALIGAALPSFWLGLILIDLFSVRLNWLPSMGAGTFKHLILPSLTLGIAMSGVYVRLVRSSLIESLGQDFIRSARARGISETRIFWFHAFRHCLVPVITIFGVSLGSLLGGTVIIEVLFAYPGVGKLVVDAIIQRDYPIIQGYILFMGIAVVLINLFIDLSYQYLNPEIRIKEAGRR
ncbi:ABC transporter permease [Bacillus sonorensis]|uniref:Nickel import system permease protein NikB n=2 Tax=Bacillus sonorensis TaxID=119858 RepID=M5P9C6_9BACI|nr:MULTISPECIES: nickel ABC transporter permease [Bacillus]TWK82693.1 Glutathione transport system permease protein GsiC [Bacillus paralicheniformis]ASB88590.1 Putative oligopeptide transport system permease protein oppB2 [Bacillus sonorensis]EME76601.1 oligopeptide ABC transporter permease [Bacillus sonorensis L12]MBG9915589.1 nickel transporter permease NikB [Bacillus sonorensis]MCF7617946.1 ABC transporter permease [Bacillus sonorensis]